MRGRRRSGSRDAPPRAGRSRSKVPPDARSESRRRAARPARRPAPAAGGRRRRARCAFSREARLRNAGERLFLVHPLIVADLSKDVRQARIPAVVGLEHRGERLALERRNAILHAWAGERLLLLASQEVGGKPLHASSLTAGGSADGQGRGIRTPTFFLSSEKYARATRCRSSALTPRRRSRNLSLPA